jgi:hypothetical protein
VSDLPSPRRPLRVSPRRWSPLIRSLFLATLLAAAFAGLGAAAAQTAPQQGAFQVHLPLVRGASPGQQPPPPQPEGRFFTQRETLTSRARIAVDGAGGVHLAYKSSEPGASTPAFYAYCPPGGRCSTAASFQTVALSDHVSDLQLAVTDDGRPRLLLERAAAPTIGEFGVVYDFAACDAGCASAAAWEVVRVAKSSHIDVNREERPWRVFAVDGQGRPHFVYYSGTTSFYATCAADCLAASAWSATPLTLPSGGGGDIPRMTLALTAAGQPRLLGEVYTDEAPGGGLYHLACDADCAQSDSWGRVKLLPVENIVVAQHDLEVAVSGGLRGAALLYQPVPEGAYPMDLYYLVCEGDCLDPDNWFANPVGLAQNDGAFAELELDGQGRPRIAYRREDGGGLGLLWCDSQCEAEGARWQVAAADRSEALEQELASYELNSCQKGLWSTGWLPSLALDPQGSPHIATEALQLIRCFARPDSTRPLEQGINTLRYTRLVVLPRP